MGVHQKGSHFPICVFTNNVGRRSPQKLEERRQKQMQRQWRGSQWWPARQMQRQGSQERPPLLASRSKARKQMQIRSKVGSGEQRNGPQSWANTNQTHLLGGERGADTHQQ